MRRLRVGLTGGLASGKSTVAELCRRAGCSVLDADRIVAELYRPGGEGSLAVEQLFGAGMLNADGAVDRPRLAQQVFADPEARRRLEAAIHPLVRQRTGELLASTEGIAVYEATLLVEAGRAGDFDLVVTVEADPELRCARAVARGMAEDAARARLEAQGDGAQRRQKADLVICNDGSPAELEQQVATMLGTLRQRLNAVPPAAAARLQEAVLVTGNRHKLAEAERLLQLRLTCVDLELPEIQSLDLGEVLRAKAEAAWQQLGKPLIVEDTALSLAALNGFPGPLVKWMLASVGAEGIAHTARSLGQIGAEARCGLLYRDASGSLLALGITPGRLMLPPRGDGGFGWDPVFQPLDQERTYAELPPEAKDLLGHRGRAWRSLVEQLEGRTQVSA